MKVVSKLPRRPAAAIALVFTLALGAVSCGSSGSPHASSGGQLAADGQRRTTALFTRPDCGALASRAYDFSNVPDAPTVILSASQITTPGAPPVCQVFGYVTPQEQFRLSLPVNDFSGVYMQSGCGSFCGIDLGEPPASGDKGDGAPGPKSATAPASAASNAQPSQLGSTKAGCGGGTAGPTPATSGAVVMAA